MVRDYVPMPLRFLTNTQRGDAIGFFQVMRVEPVGDRFWFDLRHENTRWVFHGGHESLTNVWWGTGLLWDPRNGTWKDIRYPAGVPASGKMLIGSTAWFRDSLYLSDWDTFQRWDPATGKWEILDPAWQDPATLQVVGDRLYGASSNAIVEILDSGRGMRILASNRRWPAVSTLDTLETFGNVWKREGAAGTGSWNPGTGGRPYPFLGRNGLEDGDRTGRLLGLARRHGHAGHASLEDAAVGCLATSP